MQTNFTYSGMLKPTATKAFDSSIHIYLWNGLSFSSSWHDIMCNFWKSGDFFFEGLKTWGWGHGHYYTNSFWSFAFVPPIVGLETNEVLVPGPTTSSMSVGDRDICSQLEPTTGTKSLSFVPVGGSNRDKKSKPLVLVGATNRDQKVFWSRLVAPTGIKRVLHRLVQKNSILNGVTYDV